MRRVAVAIAIVTCWALAGAAAQPTFRSAVDGVRIDGSVMNGLRPVTGLTRDNFMITDNGVPQAIDSLTLDVVPLNLMMVLDISGSLAGDRLAHLIEAANGLVKSLRADDRASLTIFSEPVRVAVTPTRDRSPLVDALAALTADGATSLNDAVFMALQLRPEDASESRPVLLLFSDGRDTSSWLSGSQVIEAAKRSGMLIHVVELVASDWLGAGREARPSGFLGRLADAGGGRRWFATSSSDLRELFDRALNELRSRYLLTYSPSGVERAGWHDVRVTLKNARGDVTARPGYYVP